MSTTQKKKKFENFTGHELFQQRIVCSVLSGKPIRIGNIRSEEQQPGVQAHEISFLKLIETLTNGSTISINETGTLVKFRPGTLVGGKNLVHQCEGVYSIGWFLQGFVCLFPFLKTQTIITFYGITNESESPSVDSIRTVTLPLLRHFGIDEEALSLKIKKRGFPPNGGGEVLISAPVLRSLKPISFLDEGLIKRIRGIASSARVSPQMGNRVVTAARSILNSFIPDVYIFTDHFKGEDGGKSPGYSVCLVAESTTGVNLSAEIMGGDRGTSPEEIGIHAAKLLCQQIKLGGCVDTTNQFIVLLLMALGPEDVSKARFGKLSSFSVQFMRLLRDMFGIKFKIRADNNSLILSCLGLGHSNLSKPIA